MEENKIPDTPDGAPQNTEQAQNPGSASGFSFNEVIYGEKSAEEQAAPQQGQPAATPVEGQKLPDGNLYQAKNDDKRFEYWQSRATRLENDMKRMEPVVRNAQAQAQQPVQQPQAQQEEQFPDPPEKPKRPVGYNKESAYTDPASPSAHFENELEDWRDKMDDYNSLRVQYGEAVMTEQYQNIEDARRQDFERGQQRKKSVDDKRKVAEYVQANYGLNPQETNEFINKFSNPQSITIDNLVGLYNIQRGRGGGAPVNPVQQPVVNQNANPGVQTGPSEAFRQTQRAQQVPQPMGVMSAGTNPNENQAPGNRGKGFMSELINFNNEKNPF